MNKKWMQLQTIERFGVKDRILDLGATRISVYNSKPFWKKRRFGFIRYGYRRSNPLMIWPGLRISFSYYVIYARLAREVSAWWYLYPYKVKLDG